MGDKNLIFFSNRKPSCHLDHNYWKGREGEEEGGKEGKRKWEGGKGRGNGREEGEKGRKEEEGGGSMCKAI